MESEGTPAVKRAKIKEGEEEQVEASGSSGNDQQVNVLQSPNTAMKLLPEIWEQIFRRLTPTDFMKVSGLCPEWNQLLKPYMAKKLISQVLELGVEGGISREVLLKCRDLNEETRIVADNALHRDNARILDIIMEGNQQRRIEIQRIREENLQHQMDLQRMRERLQQQEMELQRIREMMQQQPQLHL